MTGEPAPGPTAGPGTAHSSRALSGTGHYGTGHYGTERDGHLVTSLVALYPKTWRERYGPEVATLTGELIAAGDTTWLRAGLDLGTGAATERCRAVAKSSRMRLAPTVAALIATVVAVLAVLRAHHNGPATRPYFDNPAVAPLLLVVVLAWFVMEFAGALHAREARQWRDGATRARTPPAFWLAFAACTIAAETWLYLAPPIVPAAAIRHTAAAFAAGMVMFLTGMWLRAWSFHELGRYHTWSIVVSPDQPVISTGPYALVRHPGYTGGLLICAGTGLMSANWAGLAAIVLLPLAVIVWRIRLEERALLAGLQDRYRRYAKQHKRLIPLVW